MRYQVIIVVEVGRITRSASKVRIVSLVPNAYSPELPIRDSMHATGFMMAAKL